MTDKKFTFIEHLDELRSRLIKSVISIILASCIFYTFKDIVFHFIVKPVGRLIFIAPTEAFITNVKVALLGGLYLSSPFIFYQIWGFLSQGLERKERRYALIFGIFSFIFFMLGSFFGYSVIVPIGTKFLLGFGTSSLTPMITVDKYISFVGSLTFAFGVAFQLPLVILFLTKIKILSPESLSKNRKYAILIIFIVAAIFTPPDVVTQCMMAIPLIALYELSVFLSKLSGR